MVPKSQFEKLLDVRSGNSLHAAEFRCLVQNCPLDTGSERHRSHRTGAAGTHEADLGHMRFHVDSHQFDASAIDMQIRPDMVKRAADADFYVLKKGGMPVRRYFSEDCQFFGLKRLLSFAIILNINLHHRIIRREGEYRNLPSHRRGDLREGLP